MNYVWPNVFETPPSRPGFHGRSRRYEGLPRTHEGPLVRRSGPFPPGAEGAGRLLEDFQHTVHRVAGRARRRLPAHPKRRQEHLLEVPARLRSLVLFSPPYYPGPAELPMLNNVLECLAYTAGPSWSLNQYDSNPNTLPVQE